MTHLALQPHLRRGNLFCDHNLLQNVTGFQRPGLAPFLPKCSEFSHEVSGVTAPGKAALGFDDRIFPLILEFRLFNFEAQGKFPLAPLTMFHPAGLNLVQLTFQ